MNGYELEKKYKVTILNHSLFLECDEMCECGHHISEHSGVGTGGRCRMCCPAGQGVHNFSPAKPRTMDYVLYKKVIETGYFREEK